MLKRNDVITSPLVFMTLLYAMIEVQPSSKVFKYMLMYITVIICIKAMFQLPVFCQYMPSDEDEQQWTYSIQPFCNTCGEATSKHDFTCWSNSSYVSAETKSTSQGEQVINLLGIYKTENWFDYITYELLSVITLLCHIYRLKRVGGLDDDDDDDDTTQLNKQYLGPILSTIVTSRCFGDKSKFTKFLCRLTWTPEPFTTSANKLKHLRKQGKNFHNIVFAMKMVIFVYTLLFFSDMREANESNTTASTSTFSTGTIKAVVLVLVDVIIDAFCFQTETMWGKVLLHAVEVTVIHTFVFFEFGHLPFSSNKSLIVFYLLWICVHILSCKQIKNGYHTLQRLTLYTRKHYKAIDKILFLLYRAMPFVNELDVIIRWLTATTSLDLSMFFRLNDILYTLFRAKCESVRRVNDGLFFNARNRTDVIERFVSYVWFLIIIVILVLPILFFSSVNPLTESNSVTRATSKLSISTSPNIGATLFELYVYVCVRASVLHTTLIDTYTQTTGTTEKMLKQSQLSAQVNFHLYKENTVYQVHSQHVFNM